MAIQSTLSNLILIALDIIPVDNYKPVLNLKGIIDEERHSQTLNELQCSKKKKTKAALILVTKLRVGTFIRIYRLDICVLIFDNHQRLFACLQIV